LTGGEAHDCPAAEPLIKKTKKKAKKFLADKAYDSAELRKALKKGGTKPVIPNKRNRKQPFSFTKKAYKDLRGYSVACEEPLFQASLIFVSEEEGFWMKAQRRVIHAIRRRKL
jgi:IS5 family transposase